LRADITGFVGDFKIDASLQVKDKPLALIGPNGAGKTTCLKMLLGIYRPEAGRVEVGSRALFDSEAGIDIAPENRRIGYVPQNYGLFDHMSVEANVAFGLAAAGKPAAYVARRVRELLDELQIAALAERAPKTLSGGEKQRVALARALAIEPCALFLDEPLAALDRRARRRTRDYLRDCLGELNLPTIIVTHDPADALALCEDIVALEDGAVVQAAPTTRVQMAPETAFVEDFFAS
jgi:ABC-type sulfate/molybdate transport systems ATPase subunit